MFCREQAASFEARAGEIRKSAKLVFIGSGSPKMAKNFMAGQRVYSPVFVDPNRGLYDIIGLEARKSKAVQLQSFIAGVSVLRKGFRQGRTQGDPWQLGGVVMITNTGEMPYLYKSAYAGDHPPVDDVLNSIGTLTVP
jgi:hypothetical protein